MQAAVHKCAHIHKPRILVNNIIKNNQQNVKSTEAKIKLTALKALELH